MSLNQAEAIPHDMVVEDKSKPKTDWVALALTIGKNPAFQAGAAIFVVLAMVFWPLFKRLPEQWFEPETYYNHGPLVPLMAGYMIYDRWDKLKQIPIKAFWPAIIPLGLLRSRSITLLPVEPLEFSGLSSSQTLWHIGVGSEGDQSPF